MRIETTVNIRTGLVGKLEFLYDIGYVGTSSSIEGDMHLLIDSGYAKTPYSWAFSFLSLTVFALIVTSIRRKRK
jgi:hypothetical protein